MRNKVAVNDDLPVDFEMNYEFKTAFDLLENTGDSFFISGKAGTGKSTLLKYFKANTNKKIAILAPTGIAAVNVGGQTIHSFFKFPPKIIQKNSIKKLHDRILVQQLDAVVVDEVSMVRADLMDGIDHALRLNRGQMNTPFGGVQMIFIGDLFQLCPVVDKEARKLLAQMYSTPYFFSAKAFQDASIKYIELTKVYRQKDDKFVKLLNRLRNKEHTEDDLLLLNKRVRKRSPDKAKDSTVILTTTNSMACAINQERLERLTGEEFVYEAVVTGVFDEKSHPADAMLRLKKGAQVMLVKNDPEKQWVNGSLGKIARLTRDSITVDIDGCTCEVPMVKWQKIVYTYNRDEDKIEDETVGIIRQYPIKLAWAITIHKSQGQTFNKVILDFGSGAFAHGQAYVALTRCTKLDGIELKRPVIDSDIIFDERIYEFKDRFVSLL